MKSLGGLVVSGLIVGGLIGMAAVLSLLTPKEEKPIFEVNEGDMVQWQSRGKFVFPTPRKVVRVVNGEAGQYVFVEGTKTGIPIEQVVSVFAEA